MNRLAPRLLSPHERLAGWGGMSVPGRELHGDDLERLTEGATLSRGLGRSYGDSSLPPPGVSQVVGTRRADRMLSFDEDTGVLRAQAGLALHDLMATFLPRRWTTPVSPGTWYVTLGGMVASDIHGKNHHVSGTIGRHVRSLRIRVASGEILDITPASHPELFWATVGGMGLTGHILEVELQLEKIDTPWIWRESIQCPSFDELLEGIGESAEAWPQTVAWIDTLATGRHMGRGVLMRGRWAHPHEAPSREPRRGLQPTVPFLAPSWAINDLTVKAINLAYYHKQIVPFVKGPVSPHSWFTPLDSIKHWSRAYGRRGFTQHQAVIPREAGLSKVREYCELIARRGGTGLLCVLKDCGVEGEGLLSFPKPGISVPIDLPVKPGVQEFIDELNRFVLDVGGRIYLTKDGFTRREHFEAMEAERLPRFREVRRTWDPDLTLRSAQSVRLLGDPT